MKRGKCSECAFFNCIVWKDEYNQFYCKLSGKKLAKQGFGSTRKCESYFPDKYLDVEMDLKGKPREAWELLVYLGFSYGEIAEELGIKETTARNYVSNVKTDLTEGEDEKV